ncbi:MAG: iron transporter [Gemmataceae bacterium]|nr:iron transporter [Gemmataceae bacterium]
MTPLDQLKPGQAGTIQQILGEDLISSRLLEMGLLDGEKIEVIGLAPLGDPLEVRIQGYRLSLRKAEAARVVVQKV